VKEERGRDSMTTQKRKLVTEIETSENREEKKEITLFEIFDILYAQKIPDAKEAKQLKD